MDCGPRVPGLHLKEEGAQPHGTSSDCCHSSVTETGLWARAGSLKNLTAPKDPGTASPGYAPQVPWLLCLCTWLRASYLSTLVVWQYTPENPRNIITWITIPVTRWHSAFSLMLSANTFIKRNDSVQLYDNVGLPILPLTSQNGEVGVIWRHG